MRKRLLSLIGDKNLLYLRRYLLTVGVTATIIVAILLIYSQFSLGKGRWGVYHYYTNAKYFHELGYFDLYSCSIEVHPRVFRDSSQAVRDLTTYEFVHVQQLESCPTFNFTSSRFDEFREDLTIVTDGIHKSYWTSALTDKGFNPPPFWVAVAGPIANLVNLNNQSTKSLLYHADILFVVLTLIVIFRASGAKIAGVSLLLFLMYRGTMGELTSTYMQYLWLPFLALSVYFVREKQFIPGGISLAIASLLQIFPVVFLFPFASHVAISFMKKKKKEFSQSLRFLGAFTVTVSVCFLASYIYIGDSRYFLEWYQNISLHSSYIRGEVFNVGFSNLVGTLFVPSFTDYSGYVSDYAVTLARNDVIHRFRFLNLFVSVLTLLVIIRLQSQSALRNQFVYGYFLMYMFLTLSPYYYISLALLPFIVEKESKKYRAVVTVGLFLLFITGFGEVTFRYIPNLIHELSIFVYLSVILALPLAKDKARYIQLFRSLF